MKRFNSSLFILTFLLLFAPDFGELRIDVIVAFLFALTSLVKGMLHHDSLVIHKQTIFLLIILFTILLLLLASTALNGIQDATLSLRYLRAFFDMICIAIYQEREQIETSTFCNTICYVLLIHSVCIIMEIIFPQAKVLLNVYTGYTKKFLQYRATGLVNGYDFAGYFSLIGFILVPISNIQRKKRPYDIRSLVFTIATFCSSRYTTVLLIVTMLLFQYFYRERFKSSIITKLTSILLFAIALGGAVFMILSITEFAEFRGYLIQRVDFIRQLDQVINQTYSVSDLSSSAKEQYDITQINNLFLGDAIKAPTDPGIINSLFEVGVLGLSFKILFYLLLIVFVMKSNLPTSEIMLRNGFVYSVLLTCLLDLKLTFFFSTGSFELLMLVFYQLLDFPMKQITAASSVNRTNELQEADSDD